MYDVLVATPQSPVTTTTVTNSATGSSSEAPTPQEPGSATVARARPKRTGPLALFFRKVYSLARIRLETLCTHMEVSDLALSNHGWYTIF